MNILQKIKSFLNIKTEAEKKAEQASRIDDENFIKMAKHVGGAVFDVPFRKDIVCVTYQGRHRDIKTSQIKENDYCFLKFFKKFDAKNMEKQFEKDYVNKSTFFHAHKKEIISEREHLVDDIEKKINLILAIKK